MTTWHPTEEAALARQLLRSVSSGILSTLSTELPGYPFGSVTPYAMTPDGHVAVYVSQIAQHTANMHADAKACITVAEDSNGGNQQAVGRVTLVGDAVEVPAEQQAAVAQRFFAFFPEARGYTSAHDFVLYWIEPRRVRYIGGFGKIFWVEAEDWAVPDPDWSREEQGIIEHMNTDHADALRNIAQANGLLSDEQAVLVALDPEGFHLRAGDTLGYIPFPSFCRTNEELRAGMIQLSRSAAALS